MTTLYICIDESGNHSQDDCYSVAGCWHVSTQTNPSNVLASTKDRLLSLVQVLNDDRRQPRELKGTALPPDQLLAVATRLQEVVYEGSSLEHTQLPWRQSLPVVFTRTTMNSGLFRSAVEDYSGRLTSLELIQVATISSIIDPVLRPAVCDPSVVDTVAIICDANTWQRVGTHVERFVEDDTITVRTRKSDRTPGIQLADLAAYAARRNRTHGDCQRTISTLDSLRYSG